MGFRSRLVLPLLAALSVAALVLALPSAGAPKKASGHSVRILVGPKKAAQFSSAKCKSTKKEFSLTAQNHGWTLYAQVSPYSGLHGYKLPRGHAAGNYIEVAAPDGTNFASDYVPPYKVPAGGEIKFAKKGGLIGLGFMPMFSTDGSEAIAVAGVLVCK